MKTVAVTVGKGTWFYEYANRLTERINRLSTYVDDGIRCINATDVVPWKDLTHGQMNGGWAWDAVPDDIERIMWIDSDAIVIAPIRNSELPEGDFCAVMDMNQSFETAKEDWPLLTNVHSYFNAGVYIATRKVQHIFDEYKTFATDPSKLPGRRYPDQDVLNYLIWRDYHTIENPAGWTEMPEEWNCLLYKDVLPRPRIIHYAGMGDRRDQMDTMYNSLEEIERWMLKRR